LVSDFPNLSHPEYSLRSSQRVQLARLPRHGGTVFPGAGRHPARPQRAASQVAQAFSLHPLCTMKGEGLL
jgi:hypothetical protein